MVSDESSQPKDPDRKHLLEEIRRRAEEAELRRIEDEETERGTDAETPPSPKSTVAPFPAPFPVPPTPAGTQPNDQKLIVIRDRLGIAIDRGRAEKAGELLEELKVLVPNDPSIAVFAERIEALRDEKGRVESRRRPAPSTRAPKDEGERKHKDVQRKKVAELFEAANTYYQQEKYEKGAESVDAILALDPENEQAQRLRQQIEKARLLAEKIRMEESRRRTEDEANDINAFVSNEPPGMSGGDKDFWGTSKSHTTDPGYDLMPEEAGPVGPPKPPAFSRAVNRLSRIKIPVRSIVTVLVVIAALTAAYFIIDNIRNTVAPPLYSVLIFPGDVSQSDSAFLPLVEGWTDDLVRDFASVTDLRVISPTTSLGLRGASSPFAVSARRLGANYYVQWNISRNAGLVSLHAALFDTLSLSPVYTTQQQVAVRELPVLRRDIVRKCVAAMRVKLSDESEAALKRTPQVIPEAYEPYLLGRALMARQPADSGTVAEALRLFTESAQRDSTFADAQSALGWMEILMYENSTDLPVSRLARASTCVERAITLGSKSSETFRVWGMIEQSRGSYAKAVERFEASVAASPSDAESHRRLAVADIAHSQSDNALKAAQHAVVDDPRNVSSYVILGLVQQFRGDEKNALYSIERGASYAPDRSEYNATFLADVLVRNQQHEHAIEILEDRIARERQSAVDYYRLGRVQQSAGRKKEEWSVTLTKARDLVLAHLSSAKDDAVSLSELSLIYTRLGAFRDAITASHKALQLAPASVDVLYNAAKMYALQRDKTQSLDYLGKAIAKQYSLERLMDMDMYNLHSEPEFVAAVTK